MSSRNVLNVCEVDRFIDDLAQQTGHAALQAWLRGTARRWIIKHHDRYDRVVRDPATGALGLADPAAGEAARRPYEGEVPGWCAAALERGDQVVYLRLGATLHKRLRRATEALEAELRDGTLPSLERIDVPKAEAKARKRRRAGHTERRKARRANGTIPVYRATGGAASGAVIVRLTTPETLADEGCRMRHCVSTYSEWVAKRECEIYSLRDRDGKSKATIEVDRSGEVWQVKGFANGPVEPRFRPVLQGFIRARGYLVDVDRDADNLVTPQEAFPADPRELEHELLAGGGLARLRAHRYVCDKTIGNAQIGLLLRTITANAGRLPAPLRDAVFLALRPEDGTCVRIRPVCVYRVYGARLCLLRVALPLPLMNLARRRVFRGCEMERAAVETCRAAEAALARLALSRRDRLFALGPARPRERWETDLLESAADVLLRSPIDVRGLRAARHQALRQRLNQARRAQAGRRGVPCPGHLAVRRLLDGGTRDYVL
jgi:hypothetical protein